jgi:site-specific DNA recombinase
MTRRIVTYERAAAVEQHPEVSRTEHHQLERRIAAERDIEVVDRYTDHGLSGLTEIRNRSDGKRLLADAHAGKFDEVWVYRLDRLSRGRTDLLLVMRELADSGQKLVSLADSGESEDPFLGGFR